MANGIHDVHLQQPQAAPTAPWQNMPTIDPQLIAQQVRGLAAKNEAGELQNSAQMAQALRNANLEMPGVVGEGYAASGPSLLQGIANMTTRRTGQNKVRDLERQAKALRGEQEQGMQAQLTAQAQQDQINRQQQTDMASLASKERMKMEELRNKRVRANYETWVNPATGEMVNASRDGNEVVDERGNPVSIDGMIKYKSSQLGGRYGNEFKALPAAQRKDIIDADRGMRKLNEINTLAQNMSRADWMTLSRPGLNTAISTMTPKQWKQYVDTDLKGLSPSVKKYLVRINDFSSEIRNQRFGSALTVNETQLADAYLPSAEGIGLMDRTDRINMFADDFRDHIKSIDKMSGSTFSDRLTKYNEFVPDDQMLAEEQVGGTIYAQDPEMNAQWKAMQERNELYRNEFGKDLPGFGEWQKMMVKPERKLSGHAARQAKNKKRTDIKERANALKKSRSKE